MSMSRCAHRERGASARGSFDFGRTDTTSCTERSNGDQVLIDVALPDPRCVMPSLAQEELPRDPGVLKALAKHNRIDVAGSLYPCAGIYAVVEATGTIRVDDRVTLI